MQMLTLDLRVRSSTWVNWLCSHWSETSTPTKLDIVPLSTQYPKASNKTSTESIQNLSTVYPIALNITIWWVSTMFINQTRQDRFRSMCAKTNKKRKLRHKLYVNWIFFFKKKASYYASYEMTQYSNRKWDDNWRKSWKPMLKNKDSNK